jgi:hypothetical protein
MHVRESIYVPVLRHGAEDRGSGEPRDADQVPEVREGVSGAWGGGTPGRARGAGGAATDSTGRDHAASGCASGASGCASRGAGRSAGSGADRFATDAAGGCFRHRADAGADRLPQRNRGHARYAA